MTRAEILQNSIWETAKINLHSPFFQREVTLFLFAHHLSLRHIKDEIVSATMVQTINDFLALDEKYLPLMKSLLHQHCLECCEHTSYGFDVKEGETETQASLRNFGIVTAEDAWQQANLSYLNIEDDAREKRKYRYVKMCFFPPWEDEHGCELILKNGVLLDFKGESDTWLTQFEAD
ncbi:MAG: hypothetical protein AB8G15_00835 [Saprospiraceae bacterium]